MRRLPLLRWSVALLGTMWLVYPRLATASPPSPLERLWVVAKRAGRGSLEPPAAAPRGSSEPGVIPTAFSAPKSGGDDLAAARSSPAGRIATTLGQRLSAGGLLSWFSQGRAVTTALRSPIPITEAPAGIDPKHGSDWGPRMPVIMLGF